MNKSIQSLACAALLIGGSGVALAQKDAMVQQDIDLGRFEYVSNCSSCHGSTGKGDGPMRAHLVKPPTDLTTLAKRSGGVLPTQLVWEMIDGRATTAIGPHGSREMPIWGQRFRARALGMADAAEAPEWYVRGRIVALIDYLQRIQVK